MEKIKNLYALADQLSSLINCGECNLCEGESVYLMPWEVEHFKQSSAAVIEINSVYYFQHNKGKCRFYDDTKTCLNCRNYFDRPFCCRLYPLGIFDESGLPQWGVYKHCPRIKNIPITIFRLYAEMIEKALGEMNCQYLHKEDKEGRLIEGLKGPARFHRGTSRYHFIKALSPS